MAMFGSRDRRRAAALLLAGLLPWTVVAWPDGFYLVFSIGWTHRAFSGFTPIWTIFARPRVAVPYLQAWPTATFLYALALGSALLDRAGRGDRRITAGLLVLAGLNVLWFGLGVSGQQDILAPPVGAVALGLAAAYEYWTLVTPAPSD